ncbi:DUF3892 domain-containing protein [Mesorhizobium sp. C416B]|uniref:DUF3892 domain-containing protein n=1 Tax=unclassified Mesorhizobium TaxID=325217 RepID=UPI0003CEFEB1|nr:MULTISPECIES: DUF3892 domain-containing protein [unclassified Mesorhizobium]ESX49397.1 hypothetical protein X762_10990 [Mesorhizobium sp. LSHC426A00]ESX55549.1 hypothetical protein X761_14015 [Mesorhizobium sp. LSHC424B00]ESX70296.1 hypothetical protein X758_16900 [Mesorhizobium sp. LSHC416B00]WJI61681.1 DUF3892 domain-containing protein [Mesorhizobium sp. C416B]
MAGTFQVNCHKPDNNDPDRRLQGLGGKGDTQWYRTIDQLITLIEGGDKFWTVDTAGNSVWINVHTRNGRKYLKTDSDGVEPNNLLALPHCP